MRRAIAAVVLALTALQHLPAVAQAERSQLQVAIWSASGFTDIQPVVMQRSAAGDKVDGKSITNAAQVYHAIGTVASLGGIVGHVAGRVGIGAEKAALNSASSNTAMVESADWAINGASAASQADARPVLRLEGTAIATLAAKHLSPQIVRLVTVADAFRTASHTEFRLSKYERSLRFTDNIVPTHVTVSGARIVVAPTGALQPGEYAFVLRPTESRLLLDDASVLALTDPASAGVQLWQLAWDFIVK